MSGSAQQDRLKARRDFFARPMPQEYAEEWAERLRQPEPVAQRRTGSILVFRIAAYTLGLQAAYVKAVVEPRVICPVPHRLNTAFLGLAAFSGDILPCCSLARLLGLADNTAGHESRTLILQETTGHRWALPIDAALAMANDIANDTAHASDSKDDLPTGWRLRTIVDEDGRHVRVLNPETLFSRLARAAG